MNSLPSRRAKPTNDKILDIAARAFSEKGFEGARMDKIAKDAGVNKATLYYRIGDKNALYEAVLKRIFTAKVKRVEHMLTTINDVEERIRVFASILIDGDQPQQFSAIMLREIAGGGRNLPDDVLPLMGRIVGALRQTLEQGVKEGRFRPVNPFLVHMALVGACTFYASNGPIRRRVAALAPENAPIQTEMSLPDAAQAIADILLNGVRKS